MMGLVGSDGVVLGSFGGSLWDYWILILHLYYTIGDPSNLQT